MKTAGLRAICQGTSHAALVAPRHFRTAAWATKLKLQAAWTLWTALKSRLIKKSSFAKHAWVASTYTIWAKTPEDPIWRQALPCARRPYHLLESEASPSPRSAGTPDTDPEWPEYARNCQNNEKMTWCGTTLWHSFLKPWGKQNGLFLNQGDKPIWMLNLPMANPGSTMSPPNEPANGHVNQVQLSCYHFFESCMHQQVVSQVLSKPLPEHFSELISSRWGYAGYGHECVEWMLEILEVT